MHFLHSQNLSSVLEEEIRVETAVETLVMVSDLALSGVLQVSRGMGQSQWSRVTQEGLMHELGRISRG